jgi:hypothetical protein
MQRSVVLLLLVCVTAFCVAGDIVRVATIYEYVSNNPNEGPEQAKINAFVAAKQKALEERFGLDVSKITNTLQINRNDGKEVKSSSNVFSVGEVAVRGEWIETISEQVLSQSYVNGFWVVKVRVDGRARNYSTEKADIQYTFLKDVDDMDAPVAFRDGSDLFLRFISPVAGQLCVYLVDETQNAYCLLPYMNNQTGSQRIDANKEYIFFSTKYDNDADEYTLNCERSLEHNGIYLVFSPNDFTKAVDKQGGKNFRDAQLPRELTYEALMKWLTKNQTCDENMVVRREVVTIRK